MNKNLLLTILLLIGVTLPIQMKAQIKEKGFFVEGSIAYTDGNRDYRYENYLIIKPAIGYQFNSNWNLGLRMEILSGVKNKYSIYGTFVRYNFCNVGKIILFGEGKFNIFKRKDIFLIIGEGENVVNHYKEAGISIGGYLPLNKNLKLVAQYLHIGYSGQAEKRGAFINSGDWGIDANIKRLSLGINLIF